MFYLSYIKAELTRRLSKTIAISFGLAVASAIIITIISTANSLSDSQKQILNPLENVGTDILATRSVSIDNIGQLDNATRKEISQANFITTDLSKLGKAGDQFSHETYMAGTLLSFDSTISAKLDTSLVANYTQGLILNVTHQEGKIPTITAQFQTGGQTIHYNRDVPDLTDAQQKALDDARAKAMAEIQQKGLDPRSDEARQIERSYMGSVLKQTISGDVVVPKQLITQQIDTPQTDIKTENYVIAGVDPSKTDIGLILPNQITQGTYFTGSNQAIVNETYALKKNYKVGDKITLNGTSFTIVGLVQPKLYTNTADIYLPLSDLQKEASESGKVNILLVKSTNANNVSSTSTMLTGLIPGIKVTDAADTAKQVTGTLVDASNLTNKFIGLVSIVIIAASFIIVSLLSLLSVNKRIRELGTLKAIGWDNAVIVRQVLMENVTLGALGAMLGVVIAFAIIALINHYNITLNADIASLNGAQNLFRRMGPFSGQQASNSAKTNISTSINLHVSYTYVVLAIGASISFAGSLIAGTLAAFRAAKMRPQDAMRYIE